MRSSRGEIKIEEILKKYNITFEEEYSFTDLKAENGIPLRFDFAIFDDDGNIDFLIEFQGRQHYQPVSKFGGKSGFSKQKWNDNKKRKYCLLHNIKLVEIPYYEENLITYDYIMKKAGY